MKRVKELISFIMFLVLVTIVPIHSLATESEEGGFSAGEMEQDNSGVINEGGEPVEEQPQAEQQQEEQPQEEKKSYLDEKQDEMSDAKKQKELLESGLSDVKQIKKELEQSKYNLNQYIQELDGNLEEIESKISQLNALVQEKKDSIAKAQEELKEAEESKVEQYEAMKERIRFMYEKGDSTYIEMIFGATSLSEMLNKAEYIQRLSAYDRAKMIEFQETIEYIEECKEQLAYEKETLEEATNVAAAEQDAVADLIVEKQVQIDEYESDISNKEQLIKEYEEDIALQNSTIATLEQIVAAEKKRLAEQGKASTVSYNGGKFAWPAPEYTRISDEYGYRMHPTLGVEKFHNGIDMAAPNGSPVLAAYDGNVVAADYNSSMGNYIMIDHGDGLYTVYMHCSALYVSSGATVAKGELIAAVGSTGRSTGPHLHFSVRLNGNYVEPRNYL